MNPRHTFGPVVLVGLVSAGLTALAGAKPWAQLTGESVVPHAAVEAGRSPLAAALSLVLLASWGVLLVTRGRVRRAVAVLGLLAALGALACVCVGVVQIQDDLLASVRDAPHTGAALAATRTPWLWVAGIGAVIAVAATAAAVLWAPAWPAMSQKYDAPGGTTEPPPAPESAESIDLWKSMDEGHDPTR